MAEKLYGPAFPFKSSVQLIFEGKSRRDAIKTSIELILTTPKGYVVYNPTFGSHIPSLVFSLIDDITLNLISYYAISDLLEQEKRIQILSSNVQKDGTKIILTLMYKDLDNEAQESVALALTGGIT